MLSYLSETNPVIGDTPDWLSANVFILDTSLTQSYVLTTQKEKALEKTAGKGDNAFSGNKTKVIEKMKFVLGRLQNTMGGGKRCEKVSTGPMSTM